MLLALDIGNSNIVAACIDSERILDTFRLYTDTRKTETQYAAELSHILTFASFRIEDFNAAIISCVVPQLTLALKNAVFSLIGSEPIIIGAGIKTGLNICIDNPIELGADMVCTAVAALHKYGSPCVIADMGTATKLSVLDKNGAFAGGAICPGVGIGAQALSQGASLLPHITLCAPQKVIGTSTVDSMRSGIICGAAAMVDGMLLRFFKELGYPAKVVATGGLARLVVPHCLETIVLDENLIFDGLRLLWQRNQRQNTQ